MAARTVEEVQDTLDEAFAWRRLEMRALETAMMAAERESPGSPLSRALARSCAAMFYAHWEGFVKQACQCYADFVAKRRLKYSELNDGLLRASLIALARRAMTGDGDGEAALLDVARRPDLARARIPKLTMIDTKSNLRFAVLRDILQALGLAIDGFSTKSLFIDNALCDVRNTIAHGRELFPSPAEVTTLHSEVLEMMDTARDLILSAARAAGYRHAAIPRQVASAP